MHRSHVFVYTEFLGHENPVLQAPQPQRVPVPLSFSTSTEGQALHHRQLCLSLHLPQDVSDLFSGACIFNPSLTFVRPGQLCGVFFHLIVEEAKAAHRLIP